MMGKKSSISYQYDRIRQGLERRYRVGFGKLRVLRHRLSGVEIGKDCIFENDVTFVYGWRTRIGNECIIDAFAQFKCPTSSNPDNLFNIDISNNVFIGRGTIIDSNLTIKIANDVFIAPYCFITDTNHKFANIDLPIRLQGCEYKAVKIEEDVWIGAHVVIIPGVIIGKRSIVAANSTVIYDVPPNTVVAGSPARVIKQRSEI